MIEPHETPPQIQESPTTELQRLKAEFENSENDISSGTDLSYEVIAKYFEVGSHYYNRYVQQNRDHLEYHEQIKIFETAKRFEQAAHGNIKIQPVICNLNAQRFHKTILSNLDIGNLDLAEQQALAASNWDKAEAICIRFLKDQRKH